MKKKSIITIEEYKALQAKRSQRKYKNNPEWHEGVLFDSKAEWTFECHLRMLKTQSLVTRWLYHVNFILPRNEATVRADKYELDFMVWLTKPGYPDVLRFVDVKGHPTRASLGKIKTIEATYFIKIELVHPSEISSWI